MGAIKHSQLHPKTDSDLSRFSVSVNILNLPLPRCM